MITLKIKYNTENPDIVLQYMKQYTSCYHIAYNRYTDNFKQKDIEAYLKNMNNINLMNSWFIKCAAYQVKSLNKNNIIFGGRFNYFQRLKNKITKEQYKLNRLVALYSGGESNHNGNRFFQITEDLNILFKPNRDTKIKLILSKQNTYNKILQKLYILQKEHISVGYKLDAKYVYINIDETVINKYSIQFINNRIMSIDLNPNYIGWSIIDWKSESDFNIIKTGIYSIKDLNDYQDKLKLPLNNKKIIKLNNKRNYGTLQISKKLIDMCLYYKCQIFSIEDLNIKSQDANKGRKINRLVNNSWCRNKLVNNLEKKCNIFGIKFIQVKPEYSSFIGNFLFRTLHLPDPILASIELSRRGYEFYNQYITKVKEIKKNIIQPKIDQFRNFFVKSLEEFNLEDNWLDFKSLYLHFKKSKIKYRLSTDQFNLQFSNMFSKNFFVKQVYNNYKNNLII